MLRDISVTARKDFRAFFASPAAYLFLGGFLAVALFLVFWVEGFFARNIADLRPLFDWMPLLMIFLAGALTMRSWADERRAGTLELLLTSPVQPVSLVLGKFLAVEALVALALLLTLPLPVTVAVLGELDWGPVIGGYVASLCLAAAYLAIGLFVSAQSDNPIIALIVTVLVCAAFYLVGSDMLTALAGRDLAAVLAAIGSSARFQSITRGVLDLRDVVYYLSLTAAFLVLNVYQLHRLRWSGTPGTRRHAAVTVAAALAVANVLVVNVWLAPIASARVDLTETGRYTLSDATKSILAGLEEPLLIRAYFSTRTHPLLAPLVPQMQDLLSEYAVAGGDRVRVEIANPTENREAEDSAAGFGIQPTPFQTASRHSAAVVNAYFDLVISYGDEYETLGFRDLIAVKGRGGEEFDVGLANPEYAITAAVRKVAQAYRSGGAPFDAVEGGMTFRGYVSSADALPEGLRPVRDALVAALEDLKATAGTGFDYALEDPEAGDGSLARRLEREFGLRPQIAGLLDPQPFWFSLHLEGGGRRLPVALPETGPLDSAAFRRAIETAAKRLAPGFLRTVAIARPGAPPGLPGLPSMGPRYSRLEERLEESARVIDADLASGQVPEEADVLMVLAPEDLDERERFAIDQFLMRGGAVVLATSPYRVDMAGTLTARKVSSGLEDWLKGFGITIDEKMVLDPRNAALPVPAERRVAGLSLREIRMMPYPHFPDVRSDGLAEDHPVTAALDQLTLNWASPILVDAEAAAGLTVTPLVRSSADSWTSADTDVLPDYGRHPETGFPVTGARGRQTLAVALSGPFRSAFAGQDSPLLRRETDAAAAEDTGATAEDDGSERPAFGGVIERSPASAKLVVVAASSFGSDLMLDLASQGLNTVYTAPVDALLNAVDWATEDPGVVALRGKTQFANTLHPLTASAQSLWEYANYALAALGLALVWGWRRLVLRRDRARYARILNEVAA